MIQFNAKVKELPRQQTFCIRMQSESHLLRCSIHIILSLVKNCVVDDHKNQEFQGRS